MDLHWNNEPGPTTLDGKKLKVINTVCAIFGLLGIIVGAVLFASADDNVEDAVHVSIVDTIRSSRAAKQLPLDCFYGTCLSEEEAYVCIS